MTPVEMTQVTDLVRHVQDWPPFMRVALARRILETLESPAGEQSPPRWPRGPTAAEVAVMFETTQPTPTDEEVQHILEEEILRKYGP